METATPVPTLEGAISASTSCWQSDLQSLFDHAKDRFPDVVWSLQNQGSSDEEVWGHKAIIYARAPPSFQSKYFQFRPAPAASPMPGYPGQGGYHGNPSALSLSYSRQDDYDVDDDDDGDRMLNRPPTVLHEPGGLLRIPTTVTQGLFLNELEYLYTGRGLGDAFAFLFDSDTSLSSSLTSTPDPLGNNNSNGDQAKEDTDEARRDKLRKDLVFMWRAKLYSDVRISLTGTFASSSGHEHTTALFSAHRFILASRSPYFHTQLITWGVPSKHIPSIDDEDDEKSKQPQQMTTITLPSPPFTPASLHFTLGYIYTGTLLFSHRSYDLSTTFSLLRSAAYLSLSPLHSETHARLVHEMCHGLAHAYSTFAEYEEFTGGRWGVGGCRCRSCARRVPRVLEFSLLPDVKDAVLERGSRRALVGLYGEGWTTPEFASLPPNLLSSLLRGLAKRTTPPNALPLLRASYSGLARLSNVVDPWAEACRERLLEGRKRVEGVLADRCAEWVEEREWVEVLEGDGGSFDDAEFVERVMEALKRGLSEKNAGVVYQVRSPPLPFLQSLTN